MWEVVISWCNRQNTDTPWASTCADFPALTLVTKNSSASVSESFGILHIRKIRTAIKEVMNVLEYFNTCQKVVILLESWGWCLWSSSISWYSSCKKMYVSLLLSVLSTTFCSIFSLFRHSRDYSSIFVQVINWCLCSTLLAIAIHRQRALKKVRIF